MQGLYRENGNENGNYYMLIGYILGLYRENGQLRGVSQKGRPFNEIPRILWGSWSLSCFWEWGSSCCVFPHLGILDTASFAVPNGILGSPSSYVTTVWKPKSYCEKNAKQDLSTKART